MYNNNESEFLTLTVYLFSTQFYLLANMNKIHLFYEPRYVTTFVGNLTEETPCVSMYECRNYVENRI
jgi:hypothetical protein